MQHFQSTAVACLLPVNTTICGVPVRFVPGLMATQAANNAWERGCSCPGNGCLQRQKNSHLSLPNTFVVVLESSV